MRYRAFISYSHADEKWARWLLKRLESYRVPANLVGTPGRDGPIPAKLGQMFRDRDELPSAGDLSSTISAALADSDALIVICSPASARSRWVNAEVEAFRASGRGDRIFSFIIGGDPASREPGLASFPQALIAPETPGGPEREPLAADARKEGDGRDRAFLKLVAGLLGVGFNDLAQREAQQRHKRMAIITAASLLGMTIAVGLAVTAYIARNDAERRQAQAEDILGFMLGDLRKNLTKVGRLDLMRSVDDKATGYFATLNPRDLSDRALEEQARSLTGIGEVRVNEGNHKEAMTAFKEAHARTTALYQRAPKNGQRLFDLAQAQYWIGFVAWQQGRFDEAGVWLTKYKDSGVKLAAMDRRNLAWQQEEVYGYQNLAVLDESLGNYDSAKKAMLAIRAVYAKWLRERPNDYALRFEDSDKASWLGSLALREGDLKQADAYFMEQNEALLFNIDKDPNNAKWKGFQLDSLQILLDVKIKQGKLNEARNLNSQALRLAEILVAQDPSNNVWQLSFGISNYWNAILSSKDNAYLSSKAVYILRNAYFKEKRNEDVCRWLVRALILEGRLSMNESSLNQSLVVASQASEILNPFWKSVPNEKIRISMAQVYIFLGEIYLKENQRSNAEKNLNKALELLTVGTHDKLPFSRLDDVVRTLRLLERKEEAKIHNARLNAAGFVPLRPYQ